MNKDETSNFQEFQSGIADKVKKVFCIILLLLGAFLMRSSSKDVLFSEALKNVGREMYTDGRSLWTGNASDNLKAHVSDEKVLKIEEETEAAEGFLMKQAGHFAYDSLSEAEQIWYSDMESILGNMEKDIKLSKEGLDAGLDETCIDTIFQCIMIDHPELFYVSGYSYNQYIRGVQTTSITFSGNYTMEKEEAEERRAEIEEAADALLAEAPVWVSEYYKIKYVYETLIENTEYDLEAEDNQNIYSVFVNHKSVCQGYAKATQYLLLKMGIECVLVQGTVDTGEAHSWNLVKADGDYYYVDTTWGDASYQVQEGEGNSLLKNVINYDYLCVTTEQLLRTHILGGLIPMPMCTAQSDNYYVQEGALFSEYDEEQLAYLFDKARKEQRTNVTIKCEDSNCFREMKQILIDGQKIFDFMENDGEQVSYACNDKQLSFMFWTE